MSRLDPSKQNIGPENNTLVETIVRRNRSFKVMLHRILILEKING